MQVIKTILSVSVAIFLVTCNHLSPSKMNSNPANHLKSETSLYLQQHAHNPVDWYPWSTAAWEKAKAENKLVLISIGYSSCHWCHVMEKETFTDSATAKIMNEHFICIKVDREERPDIDQIYMKAVQLMTGSGGWPLNCFALPNGKPIYGGTYFPNNTWNDLLYKLSTYYKENQPQAEKYAEELLQGIHKPEIVNPLKDTSKIEMAVVDKTVEEWTKYFDFTNGGTDRSPKFPLPNNYEFLLRYAVSNDNKKLNDFVELTLKKMAYGGIYDQVGGGFARYSTDNEWKLPHFEKMLYDNAQLISLYSKAFQHYRNPLYKQIALETIAFLKREMSDGKGRYYSALDADSEDEEGKFYVWNKKDFEAINFPPIPNGKEKELLADYFNINKNGYWEHDNYILLRDKDNLSLANKYNLSNEEFEQYISDAKELLLTIRNARIHPGLDKKVVTSWNALMVNSLCDAYSAFGDDSLKEEAVLCMNNILEDCVNSSGNLLHIEGQKDKLETGYLDDYAFTISALIELYQSTFNDSWLTKARELTEDGVEHYYDSENGLFWFTSNIDHSLISRIKEITDNVIPSSNSEMANNLFILGEYFDDKRYSTISREMAIAVMGDMPRWGSAYSNWANLIMNITGNFKQTVIAGKDAMKERKSIASNYLPNMLLAGSVNNASKLSLLEDRFVNNKTLIYVCENKTCKLPVETTSEALKFLKN